MNTAFAPTPVYLLDTDENGNEFYIKREDLLPYSFGGNKVRIALEYLRDMHEQGCTHMVAYGNARSNLCRVLSNLCAGEQIPLTILRPADDDGEQREAMNGLLCERFGARIVPCLKTNVAQSVDRVLDDIRRAGEKPYYIYGDRTGQGNRAVPVRAYAGCTELLEQSRGMDMIVLALGTGMTQAGILCAQMQQIDPPEVLGISIARDEQSARSHIAAYMHDYLGEKQAAPVERIRVCDRFRSGYGLSDEAVQSSIRTAMMRYGLPLDGTYTGKAFHGLLTLAREENWRSRKILFLHTGGTPLFFDGINA